MFKSDALFGLVYYSYLWNAPEHQEEQDQGRAENADGNAGEIVKEGVPIGKPSLELTIPGVKKASELVDLLADPFGEEEERESDEE